MFSCTSAEPVEDGDPRGCLCRRPEVQSLTRRINTDLSRRGFVAGVGASMASLGLPARVSAQAASGAAQPIMFTNFRLFDGKSSGLRKRTSPRHSGPRNPYPGKLGVVEEGALADLIVVDGNPVDDIGLVASPEKTFLIIMKDGKVYKNAPFVIDERPSQTRPGPRRNDRRSERQ
jgi:hypothetical protein